MKLKGKLQKEVLCIVAIAVWCALFQLGEIYDLCLFFFLFQMWENKCVQRLYSWLFWCATDCLDTNIKNISSI